MARITTQKVVDLVAQRPGQAITTYACLVRASNPGLENAFFRAERDGLIVSKMTDGGRTIFFPKAELSADEATIKRAFERVVAVRADMDAKLKQFALFDGGELVDGNVNLAEFYVANDLEPEQVNEIGALEVGQSVRFGGGAAPLFFLTRVR